MMLLNSGHGEGGGMAGSVVEQDDLPYDAPDDSSSSSSNDGHKYHNAEEDAVDGDEEADFLQEVNLSWLERFWSKQRLAAKAASSAPNTVANRLRIKQRDRFNDTQIIGKESIRRNRVIGNIPLAALMEEESKKRDDFQVRLQSAYGLGVDWSIDRDSAKVVVHGFSSLVESNTGDCYVVGAAEACGLLAVGDELLAVNDCWLWRLDLMQVRDVVMKIDSFAQTGVQLTFRYAADKSTAIAAPSSSSSKPNKDNAAVRKSLEVAATATAMKLRYSLGAGGFFDDHIFERRDIFDMVSSPSSTPNQRIKDSEWILTQARRRHRYPSLVQPVLPWGHRQLWSQCGDEDDEQLSSLVADIHRSELTRYLHSVSRYFLYMPRLESCLTARQDLIRDAATREFFLETGLTTPRDDVNLQYYPLLRPMPTPLLLLYPFHEPEAVAGEDKYVAYVNQWQMFLAQLLQKEGTAWELQVSIKWEQTMYRNSLLSPSSPTCGKHLTAMAVQKLPSLSQLKKTAASTDCRGGSAKLSSASSRNTVLCLPTVSPVNLCYSEERQHAPSFRSKGKSQKKEAVSSLGDHLIPPHHDSVRSLLALPYDVHCLELVRRLDTFFRQYSLGEEAVGGNIRLQTTRAKLSLPPFDLTYQLYYSILHYAQDLSLLVHLSVLDHMNGNITLYYLLDKWRRLFDIAALVQALEAVQQDWHAQAIRSPASQGIAKPRFDYSTSSLSLLPNTEHITGRVEQRYIVYVQDDPSLTQDITVYIQVIEDLLTLYTVLQVMMSFPVLIDALQFRSEPVTTVQQTPLMRNYFFVHLPYQLEVSAAISQKVADMTRPVHGIPLFTDDVFGLQLDNMAGLLHVDMLLVLLLPLISQYPKSIRCLEQHALKKMRISANPTFHSKEERLLQLVQDGEIELGAFLQRYQELVMNAGDGGEYLYLTYFVAKFLPFMLLWSDDSMKVSSSSSARFVLGIDLVVHTLSPLLGPQYFRASFFPELTHTYPLLQTLRCRPSLGNDRSSAVHGQQKDTNEQQGVRSKCERLSQVLTRWMRQHYSMNITDANAMVQLRCDEEAGHRKSAMLLAVEDWLELHLYLHFSSPNSAANHNNHNHLVAARSILRGYTSKLSPMVQVSLDLCLRYGFNEGALLLLDSIVVNEPLSWQMWELVQILSMRLLDQLLQWYVRHYHILAAGASPLQRPPPPPASMEVTNVQSFLHSLRRLCPSEEEDILDFCLFRPIATVFSSLAIDSLSNLFAYEALAKFVMEQLLPFFADKSALIDFIAEAHCCEVIRSHHLLSIDFYLPDLECN